jgi:hypothetical protein
VFLVAEPRPWSDIPGVQIIGVIVGLVILWAAIRAMFGKKK